MKPFLLSAGLALAGLAASVATGQAGPAIKVLASGTLRVESARLGSAAGGVYVSGAVKNVRGYATPSIPHVHVAAYDSRGRLVAQENAKLNRDSLVRSHLQPNPRAPYAVFLPEDPAQIAHIVVSAGGGHPASQ